jgi:hypothetical protein
MKNHGLEQLVGIAPVKNGLWAPSWGSSCEIVGGIPTIPLSRRFPFDLEGEIPVQKVFWGD